MANSEVRYEEPGAYPHRAVQKATEAALELARKRPGHAVRVRAYSTVNSASTASWRIKHWIAKSFVDGGNVDVWTRGAVIYLRMPKPARGSSGR